MELDGGGGWWLAGRKERCADEAKTNNLGDQEKSMEKKSNKQQHRRAREDKDQDLTIADGKTVMMKMADALGFTHLMFEASRGNDRNWRAKLGMGCLAPRSK